MSLIDRNLFYRLFRVDPSISRCGMLLDGDMGVILALLKMFRPRRVAEFGVGTGEIAMRVLKECEFVERYLGVDVPAGTIPILTYQRHEVPADAGQLARSDPRFELVIRPRGTMDLSVDDIGPMDFVFIDGDHSAMAVRHDTQLARDAGSKVIIWHDYNNGPAVGPGIVIDELNRLEGDHICLISGTILCFELRP